MNTRAKTITLAVISTNLMILLFINMTSQMELVSHFILMPLLFLQTMAVGGYFLEFSHKTRKDSVVKIRKGAFKAGERYLVKPAA